MISGDIKFVSFHLIHNSFLLYRARRRVSCSLEFEFPGGEIRTHEKDTFQYAAQRYLNIKLACSYSVFLTSWAIRITYLKIPMNVYVNFSLPPLNTLEPEITVQEHAYHIWVPCEPSIHQKIKEPITSQTRWGLYYLINIL